MNTKADGKSYDICVYTSPEKIPFVRRLFRQILTKPLLLHLFSSVGYSRIFVSFFNPTFQIINYITFVLFHGFREHCKHKFFSYDDSRLCCLLLYIFTILHFPQIFSLRSPALEGKTKRLQAPVVILRAPTNYKFELAVKTGQSNHS